MLFFCTFLTLQLRLCEISFQEKDGFSLGFGPVLHPHLSMLPIVLEVSQSGLSVSPLLLLGLPHHSYLFDIVGTQIIESIFSIYSPVW